MTVIEAASGQIEATAASTPEATTPPAVDLDRLLALEAPFGHGPSDVGPAPRPTQHWMMVRAAVAQLIAAVLERLRLGWQEPPHDELGRGHVLDGQPDRLEDGDGLRVPARDPGLVDAADLHQRLL